jgi:hypothetical protein
MKTARIKIKYENSFYIVKIHKIKFVITTGYEKVEKLAPLWKLVEKHGVKSGCGYSFAGSAAALRVSLRTN